MQAELSKQSVVLGGLQEAAEAAVPEAFEDFDEHDPVEMPTAATATAQTGKTPENGVVGSNMVMSHKRTARGVLAMRQCLCMSASAIITAAPTFTA